MNLLYLGILYDKNNEQKYIKNSKVGLQGAANTFQWNFIDGIIDNGCRLNIFNTISIGTYPRYYKKLYIKNREWKYRDNVECREIGFINIPIVKQCCRIRNYKKKIINWIENTKGEKAIIAYSIYYPYLKVLNFIKNNYPEVKLSIIVTDLPGKYGILPKNRIKSYFMNKCAEKELKLIGCVDKFVLLTEQMKVPLNTGDKPYVVIEGICDVNDNNCLVTEKRGEKKIVLYTGTLLYQFGIKNLLNAFKLIKDNDYELWICGSGEAEKEIKEMSYEDERVKFYGYISKKEVYKLQQQATVLINPRTNEGEYTKYSFPSKTMEYMTSGVPVIMYKLDGIPKEYEKYIYYVKGNSIEALKDKIIEVCEKSEKARSIFAEAAKNFVIKNKSSYIQVKKTLDMLYEEH